MFSIFYNIKAKIGLTISSALSALGAGSSTATAVCQTTCSAGSALPFILGFTLSATTLTFIENYQLHLWLVSSVIFTLLVILYLKRIIHSKTDKAFLFLNAGLLIIGFPYLRNFSSLLFWTGIGIILYGFCLLFCVKRIAIKWI